VTRTLEDRRTTFVVVSTLEPAPLREAEFFMGALAERKLHLGATVLNKVLPPYLLDEAAADIAEHLSAHPDTVAAALPRRAGPRAQVQRVLREVGDSFLNFRVVARREAEQRAELGRVPDVVASAPYLDSDVFDLAGLLTLGAHIWR
jgi:hypothetical protein